MFLTTTLFYATLKAFKHDTIAELEALQRTKMIGAMRPGYFMQNLEPSIPDKVAELEALADTQMLSAARRIFHRQTN